MNNCAQFKIRRVFTTLGRVAYLLGGEGSCQRESPLHLSHLPCRLPFGADPAPVRGGRCHRPVAFGSWSVR